MSNSADYDPSIPATQIRETSDGLVVLGGQIALQLLGGSRPSFVEEAWCVISNCQMLLSENGLDWSNVLRMTVYLTDLGDRPHLDQILRVTLSEPYPVRSVVEVTRLARGAAVEIELTASRTVLQRHPSAFA